MWGGEGVGGGADAGGGDYEIGHCGGRFELGFECGPVGCVELMLGLLTREGVAVILGAYRGKGVGW